MSTLRCMSKTEEMNLHTQSLVFRSCADPFHHETDGAGLEPVTSHLNSYEWLVDKYFIFLSKTIVNGRTGRDKEEIERKVFKLYCC